MTSRSGSSTTPPGALLRSALSVAMLVVLVVGVPIALAGIGGSPLPQGGIRHLRAALESRQGFDAPIVTSWLIHGALLVAWATWAWLAVCVTLELRSWSTGRTAVRLPGSRTLQAIAACLVGTSLALMAQGRALPAPVATIRKSGTTVSTAASIFEGREDRQGFSLRVIDDLAVQAADPDCPSAHPPLLQRGGTVHEVGERETLWSIAEVRLGSARRWREIAELNYSVVQPDGRRLVADHWVAPGWRLVLPPSRLDAPAVPYPPAFVHGSHLSGIAAPEPVNEPEMASGRLLGIHRTNGGTSRDIHVVASGSRPGGDVRIELLGAGLLGAGVVSLLDRMRRAQQRHRSVGEQIRLPEGQCAVTERRLRSSCDRELASRVDRGLRRFVSAQSGDAGVLPSVLGIRVGRDQLRLVVESQNVGEVARGQADTGPRSVAIDVDASDGAFSDWRPPNAGVAPLPAVVTVGREGDGSLLVNLEALGSLGLVGDALVCEDVVRALALELAVSGWGQSFDLMLVGFGYELGRFERVIVSTDHAALVAQLHRRRLEAEARLQAEALESFAQARMSGRIGWDPLVVVCGPTVGDEERGELVDAASHPRTGSAIVVCGSAVGIRHTLNLSSKGGSSSLEPIGSVVFPQMITDVELKSVGELVETALDLRSVAPRAPAVPYDDSTSWGVTAAVAGAHAVDVSIPDPDQDTSVAARGVRAFEVEVAVLGPVEINGAARPFTRAWARELVVYLALHPHGASNDGWATALWPDRLMAASSLHSTASVARRSLGQDHRGRDHLPKAHGRLILADTVGTDWDRFVELSQTGDASSLRNALELVRGRPFDGLRAGDWPVLEGIAPAIEAAVVDAAGRLAGISLRQGDPGGAQWAARRGLLVSPYDERLYRMLLRAADSSGNPAGVEAVMAELIRLVADDVEPFDSVHPSTMELYRSLTRRRSVAASGR